jgi:guanylate kinase
MSSSGPVVVVLTAPSGSGKTSLARRLLEAVPGMRFSVSATTRSPRPGERDGESYHFLSRDGFRARADRGDFAEFEEVYPGLFYGTLRSEIERSSADRPVLLDVDVKGAARVKEVFAERVLAVFVRPPSIEALEARLRERRTEDETALRTRLERARLELTYEPRFDATVVNDDLDRAAAETIALVRSFLQRMQASEGPDHD